MKVSSPWVKVPTELLEAVAARWVPPDAKVAELAVGPDFLRLSRQRQPGAVTSAHDDWAIFAECHRESPNVTSGFTGSCMRKAQVARILRAWLSAQPTQPPVVQLGFVFDAGGGR